MAGPGPDYGRTRGPWARQDHGPDWPKLGLVALAVLLGLVLALVLTCPGSGDDLAVVWPMLPWISLFSGPDFSRIQAWVSLALP